MHVSQIILLGPWNLHSVVCQLYLNKTEKKKKKKDFVIVFFFLFVWLGHAPRRVGSYFSKQGLNLRRPALEAQSLNH